MVELELIIVENACENLSLAVIQHGNNSLHTHRIQTKRERAKLSRIVREFEAVVEEWVELINEDK